MRHADRGFRSGSGLTSGQPAQLRFLWLGVSVWLFLAATLLAGAPRASALVLGAVAFLLGAIFFRQLRSGTSRSVLVFFGFGLWTALSAVPLPCSMVRALAPGAGRIWLDALAPVSAPPLSYCALSIAPPATVQSALNLASYGVIAGASTVVARRFGLWAVALSVFGVAVFVALLTLVHGLLGLDHLLGWSLLPAKSAFGPASVIVNPNNLAGYMNLGAFCGLGLLAARRPPVPRALAFVGCVVCVATMLASASRGAALALAFGTLAWVALYVVRIFASSGRMKSEAARQAPLFLVVVAGGALVAFLGSNPDIERELFGEDMGKVRQLGLLAPALGRVDWTGVGRGGFDSISARLTNEGRNYTYEYAENFVLSWLLEWGPVVGALALVGLAWFLWPARLVLRGHPSAEAVWLGLIVVLLQNFGDLGLELPGLAGAFVALGAGLQGSRGRRGHPGTPASSDRAPLLGGVLALVLVTALWTLATGPALSVTRDRTRSLAERALAEGSTVAEQMAAWHAVKGALVRFPAEPYFVIVGGWLTLRQGGDAMPWAAEALRRAPRSARAHVLVAEVLVERSAVDQALLHVRLAAEADPTLTPALAERVVRLTTQAERLEAGAPEGQAGARFLLEIMAALPPGVDPRGRRHLLEAAVRRAEDDPRVQAALGWALLDDLRRGASPCPLGGPDAACPVRADARARISALAAATKHAPACDGLRLESALLVHDRREKEALTLLSACPSCAAPMGCAKDRVGLALDHGDEATRRLALGAFRATACDTPPHCADAEGWLAGSFARRARPDMALVHAWRAAEIDPSVERYLAAARAARDAGRAERVEFALERARRLGGQDAELARWLGQHRTLPEIPK